MGNIDAVVLAGGSAQALDPSVPYKGALEVAGKPMVEWVIDALRQTPEIRRIVVTVPTLEDIGQWAEKVDQLVETDGTFAQNVLAGIDACHDASHVAICTGDIPAVTSQAVSSLLQEAQAREAAVAYPFISQQAVEQHFPDSERTYFKIDGGRYTAGNLVYLSTDLASTMDTLGQKLFESRKNALELAAIAGPTLLMQFAAGKLTTERLEKKGTEILGAKGCVVKTDEASLGMDVDKPGDLRVMERVLSA